MTFPVLCARDRPLSFACYYKLQFAIREKGVDVVEVARGELVEVELNRLVEKRHDRRVTDEGGGVIPNG